MKKILTLRFFKHKRAHCVAIARSDFEYVPELFSALSIKEPLRERPFTVVTLSDERDFKLFAESARSAARALDIDLSLSVASATS